MILSEKYGQHQPLNRQADRDCREGVDLSLSTLADQVGGCAVVVRPIYDLVCAHCSPAAASTVTTRPFRCWPSTRPARPIMDLCAGRPAVGGLDPPAAVFFYSRDRTGDSPPSVISTAMRETSRPMPMRASTGCMRRPSSGADHEAACWSHGRRKFFVLADVAAKARGKLPVVAPFALETVKRIDAIFAIEREISGQTADERLPFAALASRDSSRTSKPGCGSTRQALRHSEVAKAMDYMLKRWPPSRASRRRADLPTNNAAERELRGIALGRKSWLFAGSDRGGEPAAVMYT